MILLKHCEINGFKFDKDLSVKYHFDKATIRKDGTGSSRKIESSFAKTYMVCKDRGETVKVCNVCRRDSEHVMNKISFT